MKKLVMVLGLIFISQLGFAQGSTSSADEAAMRAKEKQLAEDYRRKYHYVNDLKMVGVGESIELCIIDEAVVLQAKVNSAMFQIRNHGLIVDGLFLVGNHVVLHKTMVGDVARAML